MRASLSLPSWERAGVRALSDNRTAEPELASPVHRGLWRAPPQRRAATAISLHGGQARSPLPTICHPSCYVPNRASDDGWLRQPSSLALATSTTWHAE